MSQTHAPYSSRSLYHGWLPQNAVIHRAFLEKHVAGTINGPTAGDNDWVTKFICAVQTDPVMKKIYPLLFEQVNKDVHWETSDERFRVRDLEHLRSALNSILQGPPEVLIAKRESDGKPIGEPIGVPIYLILDLLSNTSAGYDLFRTPEFNQAACDLLHSWGEYLKGPGSNSTLTTEDKGWFGQFGLRVLESGLQGQTFYQTYGVQPSKAQETYQSWDSFFTRSFVNIDKQRPVSSFRNPDVTVIYNACESTSFRTAHNVQRNDTFWLKGQNYSLYDMLGSNTPESLSHYADSFAGGSVYQAFLSPQDYHHWHSPIKGKVLAARKFPGTYYATLPDEGAPASDLDYKEGDPHGALIRSQSWLSISAARGVIIIKPDEPSDLELVAVIAIGMVEVSTIDIDDRLLQKDAPIDAGGHLGMFHFGGSSHVVILKLKKEVEKKKKIIFKDIYDISITPGQHRWVRSIIGRVVDIEEWP